MRCFYGLLDKCRDRKLKMLLLTAMYAVLLGGILLLLLFFGSTEKQIEYIRQYIENEVSILSKHKPLFEDTINEILKVGCIKEYNVMSMTGVRLSGCTPVIQDSASYHAYLKEAEKNAETLWKQKFNPENIAQATVIETNNTRNSAYFLNKGFRLAEGTPIGQDSKDKNGALISRGFAEENHLQVGDIFETQACANDFYYAKALNRKLKVKGIFTHNHQNAQGRPAQDWSNYIFVPIGPISQTYMTAYERMTVFLKNGYTVEDLKKGISEKSLYLQVSDYAFCSSGEWGEIVSEPLHDMQEMSRFLLLFMLASMAAIILLLGAFYLKGNLHNLGILLGIGVSKKTVLLQFLAEESIPLLLGALLALGAGAGSMDYIAQAVDSKYTSEIGEITAGKNAELLDGRPEMQDTVNELRTVGQVMRMETGFKTEYTLNGRILMWYVGIVCVLFPCCIGLQIVYKLKRYPIKAMLFS